MISSYISHYDLAFHLLSPFIDSKMTPQLNLLDLPGEKVDRRFRELSIETYSRRFSASAEEGDLFEIHRRRRSPRAGSVL